MSNRDRLHLWVIYFFVDIDCRIVSYRDREMHFKGVQRQNILQSFKEGCSIRCLQEPKQVKYTTLLTRICVASGWIRSAVLTCHVL